MGKQPLLLTLAARTPAAAAWLGSALKQWAQTLRSVQNSHFKVATAEDAGSSK